jgi:hypothetical protein
VKEIAPQVAALTTALAAMAPGAAAVEDPAADDDMEPVVDAAGARPSLTPQQESRRCKRKPPRPCPPPLTAGANRGYGRVETDRPYTENIGASFAAGLATAYPRQPRCSRPWTRTLRALDGQIATLRGGNTAAVLVAMDTRMKGIEASLKKLTTPTATGMDAKTMLTELAGRDALAKKVSAFVGTFDHANMTTADVAKYGVEKIGLKNVPAGQEATALDAYFTGRTPPTEANAFALDGAAAAGAGKGKVDGYINGSGAAAS